MKKRTFLLAALLTLSAAAPAFCHGGGHGSGGPGLEHKFFDKYSFLMRHRAELQLTEDQINSLTDLKYSIKRSMAENEAQAEVSAVNLYQELHKTEPDLNKLYGFVDGKAEASRHIGYDVAKALVDMKKVLSPEQLAKMKDLWLTEQYGEEESHS